MKGLGGRGERRVVKSYIGMQDIFIRDRLITIVSYQIFSRQNLLQINKATLSIASRLACSVLTFYLMGRVGWALSTGHWADKKKV